MEYRWLGRTGVRVSEVSLGTMAFGRWIDEAVSAAVLDQALEAGVNLIDTADVYGRGMDNGEVSQLGESEQILGKLLKTRRQNILLATKLHNPIGPGVNDQGQSRYHLYRALEGVFDGCRPTISTCTRCTGLILILRWRKRSRR
ncbi:aldo/keto reductase [Paenibacillus sp. CC-CFT747]|nr:aldo/keto reductase [Paenibacillus sp. CC-CFT747]